MCEFKKSICPYCGETLVHESELIELKEKHEKDKKVLEDYIKREYENLND